MRVWTSGRTSDVQAAAHEIRGARQARRAARGAAAREPGILGLTAEARLRWVLKPLVWIACLSPLAWLVWLGFTGGLGANPIEFVNRYLGDWALRGLLIALAVTPVRRLTGWNQLQRFRRLLGLFAFFYVSLHVASYVGLDQFFDWRAIWLDIVKRWYITVGMAALLCLIPLAVTSTRGWVKRLGKDWLRLHKLVYVAGALACLHFFMMRKGLQIEPLIYAGIFAGLMAFRLVDAANKRLKRRAKAAGTAAD